MSRVIIHRFSSSVCLHAVAEPSYIISQNRCAAVEQKASVENKKSVPCCVAALLPWVIKANHTEEREGLQASYFPQLKQW